jgi:hypothetical protein
MAPRGLDLSIHPLFRSFSFSNLNERRRRVKRFRFALSE